MSLAGPIRASGMFSQLRKTFEKENWEEIGLQTGGKVGEIVLKLEMRGIWKAAKGMDKDSEKVGGAERANGGWSSERLLKAWGTWYEYGRLQSAGLRPRGEGRSGSDETHLAALKVEGMDPPCTGLAQAFAVAKPALVHIYAKGRGPLEFDIPLLPGQSAISREIACSVMVVTYRDILDTILEVDPFDPSQFEAVR